MDQKSIELLEQTHQFPCHFCFKFIVKGDKEAEFCTHLGFKPQKRAPSSKGTHVSLTFELLMLDAPSVLLIYAKAKEFEGVLSL